jgi:hypothetical protein
MKRNLFVFLIMAFVVLSSGNAFADEPPNFGVSTEGIKLGELRDDTWRSGMHGLIVDGSNVYAVRGGRLISEYEVVVDKSSDGGLTWLQSTGIARHSNIDDSSQPGIALNRVTKELHFVWATYEPLLSPTRNLYYGNGTITTRVNGSINRSDCSNIAVDGNGVIHIVFSADDEKLYYTSSSDNGVTFSAPAVIASGGWISFASDSAGNLYLAYKGNDSYYYFMKKPSSGNWSSPYLACTSCQGHDPSIAVYDSNRIYFAVADTIVATSNGGQTWTTYTAPGQSPPHWVRSLAVSSDGILNLAWGDFDNVYFVRTIKSHDPSLWGQTVLALTEAKLPNVAVDSAGKAYIMATRNGSAIFIKEK